MDILDDMGVSKLSAKVFFKKWITPLTLIEEQKKIQYICWKSLNMNLLKHIEHVEMNIRVKRRKKM